MKKYVGTQLEAADFRAFSIKAAEAGLSKSALLRKLTLEALERHGFKKVTPRKKGVAA